MEELHSVLIVEDEAIMAMYLKMMLKREGFEIAGAVGTGEEAVAVSEQKRPDVILMDIRLAGDLDGIDAAREIGTHYKSNIIFMTGYSNSEIRERAEELHPIAYLVKPFDIDLLIKKIRIISK